MSIVTETFETPSRVSMNAPNGVVNVISFLICKQKFLFFDNYFILF
jgi:hypothetical protein